MEKKKRPLTAKERKQLEKKRKKAAKEAEKYHKAQSKKASSAKSSDTTKNTKNNIGRNETPRASVSDYSNRRRKKPESTNNSAENNKIQKSNSKIINAVNSRQNEIDDSVSREERYRLESNEKIRNLEPKDFDDGGYYVDEFSARRRQERRAKEIRNQEREVIRRPKKPVSPKHVRRVRILIYSSIFAVVLIIGIVLSLTVLFKTEKIDIEGCDCYYDEEIIQYSNVALQGNIFINAMSSTPKKISENLPYVEDAKIGFSVPDTITINITQAVPAYVIKNGSNYLLISSKGRIIDSLTENTGNLPELTCDELQSMAIGDYVSFSDKNIPDILLDITECLEANNVTDITGFDVTNTANITLNYDNRILIKLGLPEDIDYKIRTAVKIITEKLDPNNTKTVMGTLDVSACNTTKMSHYKPAETTVPPTTQPTTEPETTVAYSDSDSYVSDDSYSWDSGTYYDDYSGDSYDTYSDDYSYDGYDSYDSGDYSYDGYDSYDSGDYSYEGNDSYYDYSYEGADTYSDYNSYDDSGAYYE